MCLGPLLLPAARLPVLFVDFPQSLALQLFDIANLDIRDYLCFLVVGESFAGLRVAQHGSR